MTSIVAVAFPKGGTGKSTVSANLAAAAARRGFRPLLIDLDPQGSSSLLSGFDKSKIELANSSGAMFMDEATRPSDLAVPTKYGYDIVPACGSMIEAEAWLNRASLAIPRLRLLFNRDTAMHDKYDFIIVDTIGAKQTKLLDATLLACSDIVIPLRASALSTSELPDFVDMIKLFSENRVGMGDKAMVVRGVVINAVKANTNASAANVQEVTDAVEYLNTIGGYTNVKVCVVPDAIAIEEAATANMPVSFSRPQSKVAIRYQELFAELFPD
jgi:chromosome partitioning protein